MKGPTLPLTQSQNGSIISKLWGTHGVYGDIYTSVPRTRYTNKTYPEVTMRMRTLTVVHNG